MRSIERKLENRQATHLVLFRRSPSQARQIYIPEGSYDEPLLHRFPVRTLELVVTVPKRFVT